MPSPATLPRQHPVSKLYIAVRSDLPPGLQASQAVHVGHQFAVDHPESFAKWFRESNTVVIVSVPDTTELLARCVATGVTVSAFKDDDLGDSVTALAIGPGDVAKKLCQQYKLAMKEAPAK